MEERKQVQHPKQTCYSREDLGWQCVKQEKVPQNQDKRQVTGQHVD